MRTIYLVTCGLTFKGAHKGHSYYSEFWSTQLHSMESDGRLRHVLGPVIINDGDLENASQRS